jgi:hypothetical protein
LTAVVRYAETAPTNILAETGPEKIRGHILCHSIGAGKQT